jgi:Concanavalin A-like lectin/glucanases superfamily
MKYHVLLAFASLLPAAFAQTPILEYKFDNGSLASTGSVTTDLTLQNSAATDTSGGTSSGIGDGVLNLSAALGMGSLASPATNAPAGFLTDRPTEINQMTSFTIQGWFKTDGSLINGNANIMTLSGPITLNATASGRLSLNVDGTSQQSATGGYNTTSTWTFFAVTYDGTIVSSNLKFYVGNTATGVSQLGTTLTLNSGTVGNANSGTDLVFGNSNGRDRGFDGLLDNLRLFGSKTDASGVLTLSDLEAIRTADITAIPEPSSSAAILAGLAGLAVCLRRRPRATSVLR